MKIGNLTFQEMNKDGLILISHKKKEYVIEVVGENIEWDEYQKPKIRR